jgi:hypothetical protein
MKKFSPINDLELALIAARHGEISVDVFLATLIGAELALPTTAEVKQDGSGFNPVFFEKEGIKMLSAFSDVSRCTQLEHLARYSLVMSGLDVLRRMPPGIGLVINPGFSEGLELSPTRISEIVRDTNS